ncbi:unnamed protein product [Rhodiola kirilowii]
MDGVGNFVTGLILQGNLLLAIDFVVRHNDCLFDIAFLSTLVSILLSCVWFAHPLTWEQFIGAAVVFGSLYAKTLMRKEPPQSYHYRRRGKSFKMPI